MSSHMKRLSHANTRNFHVATCILCLFGALGAVSADSSPKRVRLDVFTITVRPTEQELTLVEAKAIREVAETMLEDYFNNYAWGSGIFYDYAGLAGIKNVTWFPTEECNVIELWGGIVSFAEEAIAAPQKALVQAIVQTVLNPRDGASPGLTETLQQIDEFRYVSSAEYAVVKDETLAPTSGPTLAPSTENSNNEDELPPKAEPKNNAPESDKTDILLILFAVLGATAFLVASAFLVYRQVRRRAFWHESAEYAFSEDKDDLEIGLGKSRAIRKAVASDSGSSPIGCFLSTTLAAVHDGANCRLSNDDSQNTPGSSSDENSDGVFDFDPNDDSQDTPVISSDENSDGVFDFVGELSVTIDSIAVPDCKIENSKDLGYTLLDRSAIAGPRRPDELNTGSTHKQEDNPDTTSVSSAAVQGQDEALDADVVSLVTMQRLDVAPGEISSTLSDDMIDEREFSLDDMWDFQDNDNGSDDAAADPFSLPQELE